MDKIIILGFGIFLLVGAFFGYKAGSQVSLIMGAASSLAVFAGYFLSVAKPKTGFIVLTLIGLALAIVFLKRLLATGKFMPAGMLLAFSNVFFAYCLVRLIKM